MSAKIESLRIGPEKNFTYFIFCEATGECGLIDPAFDFDRVATWVRKITFSDTPKVKYLLATHGHWDHAGGFNQMLGIFPKAEVVAHLSEKTRLEQLGVVLNKPLKDNEEFKIGEVVVKALHTPGHTEGGCCYIVENQIFTGDTLFVGQCGRTDLAGGSDSELFNSLQKLKTLPPELTVRPGHDYGLTPMSTLETEIRMNPTMKANTLKEFVDLP